MNDAKVPMNYVSLATFDKREDAEELKALLSHEGIDAQIEDERRLQTYWFMTKPKAGVHVQVPKEFYCFAKTYFQSSHNSAIYKKAVHCPACDSARVQYPALTRQTLMPALVGQVLRLIGLYHHEYYCEDCHNTWVKKPPTRARKKAVPLKRSHSKGVA